jgi:TonB family protein
MSKRLPSASVVIGLIVGMIGLLNVAIAVRIIYDAFLSAEAGSIVFGLIMLTAGALWTASGVGYLTLKEWAPTLALYVSPVVVAINLAGVLHLWGFAVNIGWAALSTVAGVGSIWYLSKKELASFFLIAVAEHIVILVIFAVSIYSEPVDIAESRRDEVIVTIEEIKQQEPVLADIIPRERAILEKPPALPEIEIRSVTATNPGAEIEDSVPQLPRTLAQVRDTGADTVLRSPGPKEREQRYQATIPAFDVESALESSKKPSPEIGPSEKVKESPEATVAREPRYVRDDLSSPDERLGPSDEVARPSFAGKITGDIAGRKVVFWPKQPEGYKGTEGGTVVVKLWVDPAGSVIRVEVSKKSGSPGLDRIAKQYVEQIRFEELPRDIEQKVQWGEIPINFELTRRVE